MISATSDFVTHLLQSPWPTDLKSSSSSILYLEDLLSKRRCSILSKFGGYWESAINLHISGYQKSFLYFKTIIVVWICHEFKTWLLSYSMHQSVKCRSLRFSFVRNCWIVDTKAFFTDEKFSGVIMACFMRSEYPPFPHFPSFQIHFNCPFSVATVPNSERSSLQSSIWNTVREKASATALRFPGVFFISTFSDRRNTPYLA